ncbi:MAG: hypothetical protein EOM78_09895 [Erysipelotrichia bacterium]|nr:hypothetical protein [Erysipelotrichia bacterium]
MENIKDKLKDLIENVMMPEVEETKRCYKCNEFVNPTKMQKKYARAEVFLQDGNKAYDIYGYDEDVIATDIIDQFEKHRHFLNNTSSLNPVVPID